MKKNLITFLYVCSIFFTAGFSSNTWADKQWVIYDTDMAID